MMREGAAWGRTMSNFDFVFSLFSLLLGLSLAEVLGGFARTIQKRGRIRIGWPTPLLGLIVLLDVASFWLVAWALRDAIPIQYFPMLCGLVICGLYYLVASLVFPHDLDEWSDLDAYYAAHKRAVIAGVIGCNALALAGALALGINPMASVHNQVALALFLASVAALVLAKGKRANAALLAFIALQYPASAWLQMIGW
jgi:hypothetical protein